MKAIFAVCCLFSKVNILRRNKRRISASCLSGEDRGAERKGPHGATRSPVRARIASTERKRSLAAALGAAPPVFRLRLLGSFLASITITGLKIPRGECPLERSEDGQRGGAPWQGRQPVRAGLMHRAFPFKERIFISCLRV